MRYFHAETGSYVCAGMPFTLLGVQHPANWHDRYPPEQIAELGLVPVTTVGERADDALHWVTEELVGAVATVVNTPKAPEMVALIQQNITNTRAEAYLLSTDWYATRFAETGKAIPDDVKLLRQQARDSIIKPVGGF